MAKKVTLVDDLDGVTEGATTRRLVIGERTYLIDLTDQNFAKLEQAVARFTRKARETTPGRDSNSDPYEGVDQGLARSWAREQGIDVEPRGRVPLDVINAYRRAMETAASEEDDDPTATHPEGEASVA